MSHALRTQIQHDDDEWRSLKALEDEINYAEGLELTRFSAMKSTKVHRPQKKKQQLLIRKIYFQGGTQYQGDLEKVQATQADKDQKQGTKRTKAKPDSSKVKNTTPRKTKKTSLNSTLIEQFTTDAPSLPTTPQFVKKLRAIIKKHEPSKTPPTDVLHQALQEAHSHNQQNATRTIPYMVWAMTKEKDYALSGDVEASVGDDDGSVEGDQEDEGDEEDEDEDDDDDDEEDEEDEENGDEEIGNGNNRVEELQVEPEGDEVEMDLGIGEKDYGDDKMGEAEVEQEGNGNEMVSGCWDKEG